MKLDDIIKSEFYTMSTLGSQMLFDKAIKEIEYLKSLKPVFPRFVSEWIKGKSSSEAYFESIDAYYHSEELSDEIKKVLMWFENCREGITPDNFDSICCQIIVNAKQFGHYDERDKYVIKVPSGFKDIDGSDCFLRERKRNDAVLYQLVVLEDMGTRYTREEAQKVMNQLGVEWELVEVES